MHCVISTDAFLSDARSAGLSDEDLFKIEWHVSENPDAGDVIVGTGGARKLRFPAKGRGKRGGARVVTYYGGDDVPVFLLNVFVKGDRIDLSQAERNTMKVVLARTAEAYRANQRKRITRLGDRVA